MGEHNIGEGRKKNNYLITVQGRPILIQCPSLLRPWWTDSESPYYLLSWKAHPQPFPWRYFCKSRQVSTTVLIFQCGLFQPKHLVDVTAKQFFRSRTRSEPINTDLPTTLLSSIVKPKWIRMGWYSMPSVAFLSQVCAPGSVVYVNFFFCAIVPALNFINLNGGSTLNRTQDLLVTW